MDRYKKVDSHAWDKFTRQHKRESEEFKQYKSSRDGPMHESKEKDRQYKAGRHVPHSQVNDSDHEQNQISDSDDEQSQVSDSDHEQSQVSDSEQSQINDSDNEHDNDEEHEIEEEIAENLDANEHEKTKQEVEAEMQDPLSMLRDDPEYHALIDFTNSVKEHRHQNNYDVMSQEDADQFLHNLHSHNFSMTKVQFVLIIVRDTVNALLPPHLWDIETLMAQLAEYKQKYQKLAHANNKYSLYLHEISVFESLLPSDLHLRDIQHLVHEHRNNEDSEYNEDEKEYEEIIHHELEDETKQQYEYENHWLLDHFQHNSEDTKEEAAELLHHHQSYHVFTPASIQRFQREKHELNISDAHLHSLFLRIDYNLGIYLPIHKWDIHLIRVLIRHTLSMPNDNQWLHKDLQAMQLLFQGETEEQ